ncbi:bifunctional diguanylate cyclase/phosphodiesterase [Falsibacillus pallidus]|nr:EAL domain-containing protein [Falsibacillus pallidus]
MAKTYNYRYESVEGLLDYIASHNLDKVNSILVQVFLGQGGKDQAEKIRTAVVDALPKAALIGCSTTYAISHHEIINKDVPIISFTTFENTNLSTRLFNLETRMDEQAIIEKISKELITEDTKAIIFLISHLELSFSYILEKVHELYPGIAFSGGVAADIPNCRDTIVMNEYAAEERGMAVAALSGKDLIVNSSVNEQWEDIGRPFIVTKASGKTIYEIDHKKPTSIIRRYLGEDFVARLPQSAIQIPFRKGDEALFIYNVLDHGAIQMSHEIEQGEEINFAYANIEKLMEESIKELKRLNKKPVESIFLYNCIGRKNTLSKYISEELEMMSRISPVCGFFSNGEIGKKADEPPRLFAHALTYLAISESPLSIHKDLRFKYDISSEVKNLSALTHLINATSEDINQLRVNIERSESYYRSLFDNNNDFVYSTDLNGIFTSVNASFLKTFGQEEEMVIGKSALKWVEPENHALVRRHFHKAVQGKEQYYELLVNTQNAEKVHFQIKNIPITINGKCVGIYGIGKNMTEQKKIQQEISRLSNYDYDTGLPNRSKFNEVLEEMLHRAKKKKRRLAVIFVDIDRFKIINDTLGHFAGDLMLKELAARLQGALPNGAYLGRFGSDKFTILLTKDIDDEAVVDTGRKLLDKVQEPFSFKDKEFFVTASMGIAVYPQDGLETEQLMQNADTALNQVKLHGGNNLLFFSNDMNEDALRRVELESQLRRALDNGEFFLVYQPILDIRNKKVTGLEALIRWEHPQRGLVSPADFIPLAEEMGIIIPIGSWVLETASLQLKELERQGYHDLSMSINVSAQQFQDPSFIYEIKETIEKTAISPERIHLELTEGVMIDQSDSTMERLKTLGEIGVNISIDDFGTGYSSLSYIKHLPFHILKIDRSFIMNLSESSPDFAIVKAIMTMGEGLRLQVIAEGVETLDQLLLLESMNCDFAQGYYIAKPMKASELYQWLPLNREMKARAK